MHLCHLQLCSLLESNQPPCSADFTTVFSLRSLLTSPSLLPTASSDSHSPSPGLCRSSPPQPPPAPPVFNTYKPLRCCHQDEQYDYLAHVLGTHSIVPCLTDVDKEFASQFGTQGHLQSGLCPPLLLFMPHPSKFNHLQFSDCARQYPISLPLLQGLFLPAGLSVIAFMFFKTRFKPHTLKKTVLLRTCHTGECLGKCCPHSTHRIPSSGEGKTGAQRTRL